MKSIKTDAANRFSIEWDEEKGEHYISFPVSNSYVDYEEHYKISEEKFSEYLSDMNSALEFVRECKERKHDYLLLQNPGRLRGIPS